MNFNFGMPEAPEDRGKVSNFTGKLLPSENVGEQQHVLQQKSNNQIQSLKIEGAVPGMTGDPDTIQQIAPLGFDDRCRVNYFKLLNDSAKKRLPSGLQDYTHRGGNSDTILLSAPLPSALQLPVAHATLTLQDGTPLYLDQALMTEAQINTTPAGYPPLREFAKELQRQVHKPPLMETTGGLEVAMTTGCQAGLGKCFEMIVKPGDAVLMEKPTNPQALAALRPLNARIIEIETDKYGIIPESLWYQMSRWYQGATRSQHSDMPRLLYTMPTASNPTGATITEQRKREIYECCRKYDMMILEDDPFYFLQFSQVYTHSYLSMDVDGRVLRFDTFQFTMGPGYKVGFVTGPPTIVDKIVYFSQAAEESPSAISQMVLYQILTKWGVQGYINHIHMTKDMYKQKRDCMLLAADKYLRGLAEWTEPTGGIFLWLRINSITDSKALIKQRGPEKGVMVVPGSLFLAYPDEPCSFVRLCYTFSTPTEIDQGILRLAEIIKEASGSSNMMQQVAYGGNGGVQYAGYGKMAASPNYSNYYTRGNGGYS